jgi:predicted exporter
MPTADSPEALSATIARLTDEGASVAEVSKATGLSEQRIRRLASRHRVKLQPPGPARRLAVNLSRQRLVILRDLAASAQISPTQMLTRIAACALADGTKRARRWPGRERDCRRARGSPPGGRRTAFRAEEAL